MINLVLFSVVIYHKQRKKSISKTIKYKLDSSSNMPFGKGIQKYFWKTIVFVKNLEMTQIAVEGSCSLRHYDAMRTKIDIWFAPNFIKVYLPSNYSRKFPLLFSFVSISKDYFLFEFAMVGSNLFFSNYFRGVL